MPRPRGVTGTRLGHQRDQDPYQLPLLGIAIGSETRHLVTLALSVHAHDVADERHDTGVCSRHRCSHRSWCQRILRYNKSVQPDRRCRSRRSCSLLKEMSVQTPLQSVSPAWHWMPPQTPPVHAPPSPQELPQAPQLPALIVRSTHSPPQSVKPAAQVTGPCASPGQTKPILVTSVQRVVSDTPSKQQSAAPYWPPLQHSASLLQVPPKRVQVPQNPSALQGWPLQQAPVPVWAHSLPSATHSQSSSWLQKPTQHSSEVHDWPDWAQGQAKPMLVTSVQTPAQQSPAPYWPPLQHSASPLQVPPKRVQVPQKPSALHGSPLQQPPVPV